jgi:hypothetical protein
MVSLAELSNISRKRGRRRYSEERKRARFKKQGWTS